MGARSFWTTGPGMIAMIAGGIAVVVGLDRVSRVGSVPPAADVPPPATSTATTPETTYVPPDHAARIVELKGQLGTLLQEKIALEHKIRREREEVTRARAKWLDARADAAEGRIDEALGKLEAVERDIAEVREEINAAHRALYAPPNRAVRDVAAGP